MIEIYPLQKLDWSNYLDIVEYLDQNEFVQEFWSPIAITSWIFYGFDFYFHALDDVVLFYIHSPYNDNNSYLLSTCFYKQDFQLSNFENIILQDLKQLNNKEILKINYDQISWSMIHDWKLDVNNFEKYNYVCNYIYLLDNLKNFAGKNLQKKRNNLHHFLNTNSEIKVVPIQVINKDEILEFCKANMLETNGEIDTNELNVYRQFIKYEMNKTSRYIGIAVYIADILVGITLCYLRKNICEVIIERAKKSIRGLYQYLISENLKYHQVQQKYMDRQDDNAQPMLAKSKDSYHPIYKIKKYYSK